MSPDETPEDFDETEWTQSDDPTDYPEFWEDSGTNPTADIIDNVLGGEASDAKNAIYAALYGKVGERIDSLRSELRNDAVGGDVPLAASEVDDTTVGEDGDEELDLDIGDMDDLPTSNEEE